MRKFIVLILISLTPMLLASCGGKETFRSAYDETDLEYGVFSLATGEELIESLETRFGDHEHLWIKSDVVIRQREEEEKDFFTATAMWQQPGNIRLRGSRVPIGTIFDLLILRDSAFLHFPREGQMFQGDLIYLFEKLEAIGGLGPQELVSAVLVHQQLKNRLAAGMPYRIMDGGEDGFLIAGIDEATGQQFFWRIRKSDGLVDEVLVRSASGIEMLRVHYQEYRMEESPVTGGTEPFPYEFSIFVPGRETLVEADVSEFRMKPLPRRAWEVPEAREVYPLRSLQFEEDQ